MRQGIPIYILALNSDSIGIYPSIPPASQKRIMFLSLILSFFSYKYQRTNKIQNERYFHHRYLSFYFNLSLMIFRTVYRYLTFIRLSFTDDTTYLLSISYLHPYLISLTYLCFLTAGKTHYTFSFIFYTFILHEYRLFILLIRYLSFIYNII